MTDWSEKTPPAAPAPSFTELFTPKLITVLRERYGLADLRADVMAGLTVAIVALPLSMAIAIGSGVTPDRGLYTAIVGGFVISLLGGSRFQIGGPAGAFIVLVAASVERHGVDGLLLAVIMAGVFLIAAGYLRLGTYIKFIPYPVTVGFTAGIAVIIFASQIHDLFGLTLSHEPGALIPKIAALWDALDTINPAALAIGFGVIGVMLGLKHVRPQWPNILIAVALAAVVSFALSLPVETIGTRFGGIPSTLPRPGLPPVSFDKLQAVLPDALAFALLGAIESLLSAVVADGMTGRRHRSNCELVAQGFANIASGLFGGIAATGTIARTATNVRAGARGPLSGIFHAMFLLIFMLLAAPLASYIPLAALAAVLAVVAWNMVEKHAFALLIGSSWGDAAILSATFLLTIFRDLTEGIVIGSAIGAFIFINRMAHMTRVEFHGPLAVDDLPDLAGMRKPYDAGLASDPDVVVYRISGAFFFGAASTVGAALDRIADRHKNLVLDFSTVPFLDSTGANVIAGVVRKAARNGVKVYVTGALFDVRKQLANHGVGSPVVTILARLEDAVAAARRPF